MKKNRNFAAVLLLLTFETDALDVGDGDDDVAEKRGQRLVYALTEWESLGVFLLDISDNVAVLSF